jgi:siderophore synthetase component
MDTSNQTAPAESTASRTGEILWEKLSPRFATLTDDLFGSIWQEAWRQAEAEIIKRLAASVVFENLAPFEKRPAENLPPEMIRTGIQHAYCLAYGSFELIIPVMGETHFCRIRMPDAVYRLTGSSDIQPLSDPILFFRLVVPQMKLFEITSERIAQTEAAVLNSLTNMAGSICYKLIKNQLVAGAGDTIPPEKAAVAVEQLVTTGHPIHPFTKLRSNFSMADAIDITADYENRTGIGFVAVNRHYLRFKHLDTDRFQSWMDAGLKDRLQQLLPDNAARHAYGFIPVHNWQYKNWVPKLFAADIESGDICLLGDNFVWAEPTLSLRTLYVTFPSKQFYLKLPVNLQTTSYFRTVSPNATQNGVALSHIFETLKTRHPVFREKTCFLLEREGAFYSTRSAEDMTAEDIKISKQLGYILRQSPYDFLEPHEKPVVSAALVDNNRLTAMPLIHGYIQQVADHVGKAPHEAALNWFECFIENSIEGLITLMSGYGIGFEAHMQNTLTVIDSKTGQPTRLLLRDFGGIRISTQRLRQRGFTPDFFKASVTVRDSMQEVTNKLYYAFFQSVLGELVAELTDIYTLDEMLLWERVYHRTLLAFQKLKADHPYPHWVEEDWQKFIAPTWNFKSLLSMALVEVEGDYVYTDMTNPFFHIHQRHRQSYALDKDILVT